ncbi:MAG TPA: hypothetical protein VLM75_15760 [Spirochaetota bacterium]|nr:hypothetical protein [Spirochaetota bacterium]
MKKLTAPGLVLCVVFLTPTLRAESPGHEYRNECFNYTISLPPGWERSDLTLERRHLLYAFPDRNTEIKVKASFSSETDLEKIAGDRWNLSGVDPILNKIIETGRISIRRKVTGKLLVFEFRSRGGATLQRTLITHNAGILYIIQCTSPTATFYRHEGAFNVALSSFSYIAAEKTTEEETPVEPIPEPR